MSRAALARGVDSVRELLSTIGAISEATVCSLDGPDDVGLDGRDYRAIGRAVDEWMKFVAAGPDGAREGVVRALADLLSEAADSGSYGSEWDPLSKTEGAYYPTSRLDA